jgi:hypothetical protein
LEEDGYLDRSNSIHLFCVRYVFLPRCRISQRVGIITL